MTASNEEGASPNTTLHILYSSFLSYLSLFLQTHYFSYLTLLHSPLSPFKPKNTLNLLTQTNNFYLQKMEKMVGPSFIDEIDCGNFFDHIDDLLDFPVEDVVDGCADTFNGVSAAGNCNSLASIWPPETDSFPGVDSIFSGKTTSDLSAELSVPYEDIVQLEWLSNFVEDSFSGVSLTMSKVEQPSCTTITTTTTTTTKDDSSSFHNQFQTSSPVSVLESSSSYSGGKTIPRSSPEIYIPVPCGRARSKRPRPAAFNPHPAMHLISPASSCVGENMQPNVVSIKASSDSENFAESQPVTKMPKHCSGDHKKRKKIKLSLPSPPPADDTNQNGSQAVRKCMHCEITKTPQWRAGPMGPKTLCNACGVRYKSGRLFPEYRPAASPTFCPSVHSNSHKKVLEMRYRSIEETGFGSHSAAAASPELIPNTNSSILTLEYM
ncbi:PREDICTED: GATA transcription factor 8-like isoform X2 [Lupinus angustifolius]|uniref:GATA transcription factor 8-like isoform X2 n=1 Tax=Lupinus angustifolius TaxID=3871 RepID=UPI00092F9011|nr:PREDICTED: GATA transcription factor 8-like isoform X2 [Lupinus angustifolius]